MNQIDKQIETLYQGHFIKEKEVKELCQKAMEQLIDQENIKKIKTPVTVLLLKTPIYQFVDLW